MERVGLNLLGTDWLECNEIVIYGFGVMAIKSIDMLLEDFKIPFIIDNDLDKAGTNYRGIPIITLEEAKENVVNYKIVIISTFGVYKDIGSTLNRIGLAENKDYCIVDIFMSEWYWNNKKEVRLIEIHTTITEQCTFNCKNCNMFMPYFKNPKHISVDDIKRDINLIFNFVDKVSAFAFLGGEPFLHPNLLEILEFIGENYSDRIGEIGLISNGSIVPNSDLLEIIKKYSIKIHISDYSESIPYKEKLSKLIGILKENCINYRVNSSLVWTEFGFPEKPFNFNSNQVAEHMKSCAPIFRGLNDSNFYYCHVQWAAEKSKLLEINDDDNMDLLKLDPSSEVDKMKLLKYSLGNINGKEYLSFCKKCGGCGIDNKNYVKPAIQVKRKSDIIEQ